MSKPDCFASKNSRPSNSLIALLVGGLSLRIPYPSLDLMVKKHPTPSIEYIQGEIPIGKKSYKIWILRVSQLFQS